MFVSLNLLFCFLNERKGKKIDDDEDNPYVPTSFMLYNPYAGAGESNRYQNVNVTPTSASISASGSGSKQSQRTTTTPLSFPILPSFLPPTKQQQSYFQQTVSAVKSLVLPLEALEGLKEVDWNNFWQEMFDTVNPTKHDMKERSQRQLQLLALFVIYCNSIVRVLVEDTHFSDDKKRIFESMLGGVAGGEKFMYGNVIFKFARGNHIFIYFSFYFC